MMEKAPPAAPPFSPARPLAELATGVMAPVVARRAAMSIDLIAAWPEIAGPACAALTRPERIKWPRRAGDDDPFEPGVLTLACDGGIAVRIQHEADQLVERINRFFGFAAIDRLRLVQKPVARLRPQPPPPAAELTRAEAGHLDALLKDVADPELRDRLRRLGRGVLLRARARRQGK